jgi:hypothetical protein
MESIDNKIRKFGVTMLNTVLSKEKNVIIVEKKIYSVLKKIHKDYLTEEIYNEFVYEVIGKIITSPLKSVLEDIKCMKVCRDDTYYDDVKYKIREQQEFLENPFEVEIGMLECNKCHCNIQGKTEVLMKGLIHIVNVQIVNPNGCIKDNLYKIFSFD